MVQHDEFEVTIPSKTGEGQAVQERIVSLLEQLNYPLRDVFGVRLALEEALVNAIKHGNQMDPTKTVQIECRVNHERVWVRIQDEGRGFDINALPDPTLEENLEKPSGRGVLLMREFMTKVEYNDKGNCVILEKRRESSSED
jgi:serine/threonine-protein kinase RsbW